MFQMINSRLRGYINIHIRTYFIVSLMLCLGLISGVIFSAMLSEMRQQEIETFVETFCRSSAADGVNSTSVFHSSLLHNLKLTAVLWLCSVSSIFIPVSGFVVLSEGFGVGFTVGSLTRIFGVRGFALAFASVFPGGIIALPVIIHLTCCSVYYALEKRKRPELSADKRVLVRFCITTFLCILLLMCSSLVDGYISPVFVRSISALF